MANIAVGNWAKARWFNANYPHPSSGPIDYESAEGRFEERSGIVARIYRDSRMERYVVLRSENGNEATVELHAIIDVRPV